jgi:hypothetical protein
MIVLIQLIFLFILAVWLVILLVLSTWIFFRYTSKLPRWIDRIAIFVGQILLGAVVFFLPIMDEIIGGYEVDALCNGPKEAYLKINVEKIKGKSVKLVISYKDIEGTAVPISQIHHSYRDVETDEEYAAVNWYCGQGGWIYRKIMGEDGGMPVHLRIKYRCKHDEKILSGYDLSRSYQFEIVKTIHENYLWENLRGNQ